MNDWSEPNGAPLLTWSCTSLLETVEEIIKLAESPVDKLYASLQPLNVFFWKIVPTIPG